MLRLKEMTILQPQNEENSIKQISIKPVSARKNITYQLTGLLLVCILLCSVGIYATNQSLPGDMLYGFKIKGLETLVEATHVRSKEKAAHQVTRLQKRQKEVALLTAKETIPDETVEALLNIITLHWNTLDYIASTSIDSAFPKTALLETVNEFASVAAAIEETAENHRPLIRVGDEVENIRSDAVRLYRDRARSFVATETPDTALTYLTEQLQKVETALKTPNLPESSMRTAENYLDRVLPAIAEGDYAKALVAIAEAYRFIRMATYIGTESSRPAAEALITTETSSSSTSTTSPNSTPSVMSTTTQ